MIHHYIEIALCLLAVFMAMKYDGGASLYIALAAAAATTATTAYSANEQNKSIKRSEKESKRAAAIQTRQLGDQARIETMKRERQSQTVKAAIRAAAAGAGSEFDGSSFAALSQQAEFDRFTNEKIADLSLTNNINRVASGLSANLSDLSGRKQNLLVSGLQGAAQGAQVGMGFYDGYNKLFPTTPPTNTVIP